MASRDINICIETSGLNLAERGESSTNFTVVFPKPIILDSVNWFLSLTTLSTWNSFHNISSKYTNNVFSITELAGPTTTTITIPNGRYTFEDIQDIFVAQAPAASVTIAANFNTGKITAVVSAGWTLSMSAHSAYNFGFAGGVRDSATILTFAAGTTVSTKTAQWSNGITALLFNCDLTSNSSLNGNTGNVIAQFNPRSAPLDPIVYEPYNPISLQVNKKEIQSIRCKITDQSGRIIDLEGEDVVVTLRLTAGA